jgi:alanyl-tRNA synthetase
MKNITSRELRPMYLDFWTSKDHEVIKSAPLVPEGDSSVLFTIAGMQQLTPYLRGEDHPKGKMLTDIQRCIRTNDIEEVGDPGHLTCFEMLGAWSLGEYWKKESIDMTFEFITDSRYLGIPIDKLYVSVFEGDDEIPRDTEAANAWIKAGVIPSHVSFLSREHNFWAGDGGGPCGTDTEMFYDTGREPCGEDCGPGCDCHKYLEFGNNVLIQLNLNEDGTYSELSQKNIDQGLGLERILLIMNGKDTAYDTDLYENMKAKISELTETTYAGNEKSYRIIMDHLRTSTFVLADNADIKPSNKERGYVLRRLIRRSIRHLKTLGSPENALGEIAKVVVNDYSEFYPELSEHKASVISRLEHEEKLFNKTLNQGIREYKKIVSRLHDKVIPGNLAFKLFDTFGFPIELTEEIASEDGIAVDTEGFKECYVKHQENSRTSAANKFKGGLIEQTEETAKLHTATHLLHAILREMFGDNVLQKGSNINNERLRFDFSFDRKITAEEIAHINERINEIIQADILVIREELSVEEAKNSGAIGLFDNRYGETVSVYTIGDVSKEICMGPHAKSTGELQYFQVAKEEASSAGVRRIKAVLQKVPNMK